MTITTNVGNRSLMFSDGTSQNVNLHTHVIVWQLRGQLSSVDQAKCVELALAFDSSKSLKYVQSLFYCC